MLYLFCGKPRKADIKHFLSKLSNVGKFSLQIREVDIERQPSDNLLNESLWSEIFQELADGRWDVLVLSPPCKTFSRARCKWCTSPGPRPVRSATWPWGFPWLAGSNLTLVQDHNFMLSNILKAASTAVKAGSDFLLEHPEDLGDCSGEQPGSIWQLPELHAMAQETQATTWALFQCEFSAPSPKPTRFLSTLEQTSTRVFPGWPSFDSKRRYLGPLPANCGHTWHVRKLIGKRKGAWATAASAAYPPKLCQFLATLIASRLGKTDHSQTGQESSMLVGEIQQAQTVEPPVPLTPTSSGDQAQVQLPQAHLHQVVDEPSHMKSIEVPGETTERMSDQPASTTADASHRGTVIEVEWGGRKRQIVDGFGLCSANRWQPEDRGAFLEPEVKDFVTTLKNLVEEFAVSQVGDLRKASIQLVLGKLKNSPFSEAALATLRMKWARLLPSAHTALQVPEGQPFFLHLAAQTLERIKDPNYRVKNPWDECSPQLLAN